MALTGLFMANLLSAQASEPPVKQEGQANLASRREVPSPIYGVTIDAIDSLPSIVESLTKLSRRPTTRIVFDEYVPASDYLAATKSIYNVSYVMGEILDSFYVKKYTLTAFKKRVADYLKTLAPYVDLWEVANEVNGEWLGKTTTVVPKMTAAYDAVKAINGKTVLTLYYNKDCWSNSKNEMFTWATANVPSRMKLGLDYVLVSYYEDDCNGYQPDWPVEFAKLAKLFPNSKIGFGEVGTSNSSLKASYINRYYNTKINLPTYVGGYFWWYYKQDMVPYTKPLWTTLNNAIAASERTEQD